MSDDAKNKILERTITKGHLIYTRVYIEEKPAEN